MTDPIRHASKQLEADDQYLPTDGGFLLGPLGD